MSFEVDRYSSAWAHIALCADLTWVAEPPDEFIRANQRLWTQHCRISQALQETDIPRLQDRNSTSKRELADKPTSSNQNQEDGSCNSRISVKDVIPESKLSQYGNFYYDESREKCYANGYETTSSRGNNGHGSDQNDVTECWMLPEVEYWYQKLMDEPERGSQPRRRRQFRMLTNDDFKINKHLTAASGRWGPCAACPAEAALAARVLSVRPLWQRSPSPPPPSRKMRARRRQPRRLCPPSPLAYCLDAPAPLVCDPSCKFQFDPPRCLAESQRPSRLAIQSIIRNSRTLQTYRGTNIGRYTPTSRPAKAPDKRCGVWWPRDHLSPRIEARNNRFKITQKKESKKVEVKEVAETAVENVKEEEKEKPDRVVEDEQQPSTSAAADAGLRKRLYSTVLSAPSPITINQASLRLSQKLLTPGLLKLNPKIVLPSARIRPVVENKFEELEKEALEQYKASDESIDTKFRELEKQAVEQYSTSNSNTSCSSRNSGEKRTRSSPSIPEGEAANLNKGVDSVVIYSQNFPDLNAGKTTTSGTNLKNLKTPPRGEKREQAHRPCKVRIKGETLNTSSDNDDGKKVPMRWTLHVVPPKKRHLSLDVSSDEEVTIKTACMKDLALGKVKMSAHGGGDLEPLMRKT